MYLVLTSTPVSTGPRSARRRRRKRDAVVGGYETCQHRQQHFLVALLASPEGHQGVNAAGELDAQLGQALRGGECGND